MCLIIMIWESEKESIKLIIISKLIIGVKEFSIEIGDKINSALTIFNHFSFLIINFQHYLFPF